MKKDKRQICTCKAVDWPHTIGSVKGCTNGATECDCPIITDPYSTGDRWYKERDCQNPDNCCLDN